MTVTAQTPMRSCGDLPRATWVSELAGSPLLATVDAIIAAASPHGALCLCQAKRESSYGQNATAQMNHNAWGLMVPGSNPSRLQYFNTWADGAKEFATRLSNPNPPYDPQNITIGDYLLTYVGGPLCRQTKGQVCANGETGASIARYTDALLADLNRLLGAAPQPQPTPPPLPTPNGTRYTIAGGGFIYLPPDIAFKQALFPKGQTNQRPGIAMIPQFYTQHDTANTSVGADAEMHSRWFDAGGPGGDAPGGKIGIHFIVDDKQIIQKCPINEVTWHAGDGSGPGNMQSVGTELCVNRDRDAAKAERNAAILAAEILLAINKPIANLRTHWSWVSSIGGHHCPASLLPKWDAYVAQVQSFMTGAPAAPIYPNPWNIPDAEMQRLFPWADPQGPITKWIIANRWAKKQMVDLLTPPPGQYFVLSDSTVLEYDQGTVKEVIP